MKVVFHHLAFLGPESEQAAQAVECAGEQGRFWPYHDLLFTTKIANAGRNNGTYSAANLKRLAGQVVGLEPRAFGSCLDSGRYGDLVRTETDAGRARGVQSTPTLFANGHMFKGVPSFEALLQLVRPGSGT